MRRLSNKRLLIGGLVVAAVVGIVLFLALAASRSESRAKSHAMGHTMMDIHQVSLDISIYVAMSGALPKPLSSREGSLVDAKSLYLTLFGEAAANYGLGQPSTRWKESRELVDRWGNALNFSVQPEGESGAYKIRIWSNGPNGKNENGGGDDISGKVFKVVATGVSN